jgi:hypothetical protein
MVSMKSCGSVLTIFSRCAILLYRKLNIYLADTTGVLLRGVQAPLLRGEKGAKRPPEGLENPYGQDSA